jgi:predicted nucleotide-binding protein
MKPKMFIGSSSEQLTLAYAAQEGLEHNLECTVWTQGVFGLSKSTMASLIDTLEDTDFGLFILAPDDLAVIRDAQKRTIRDNVIFELGLFVGRLGIERCFMIVPRGIEDLQLPTDLAGLTPATYEPDRQDGNLVAALGPACNRIRKAVEKLGRIAVRKSSTSPLEIPETVRTTKTLTIAFN